MSIATKTGDKGTTGLLFGARVSKACPRINTVGEIDELCAAIGLIKPQLIKDNDEHIKQHRFLSAIQKNLTRFMGEVSTEASDRNRYVDTYGSINDNDLQVLEEYLTTLEESLPKQKGWVVYGDTEIGARTDFAAKLCRRAERALVNLDDSEKEKYWSLQALPPRAVLLQYINRLSDYLHLLARYFDNQASQ